MSAISSLPPLVSACHYAQGGVHLQLHSLSPQDTLRSPLSNLLVSPLLRLSRLAIVAVMSGVADAKARALEIAQRLAAKIGGGPATSSPSTGSAGGPDCKHSTLLVREPYMHHTPIESSLLAAGTATIARSLSLPRELLASSSPPSLSSLCLPAVCFATGCWWADG